MTSLGNDRSGPKRVLVAHRVITAQSPCRDDAVKIKARREKCAAQAAVRLLSSFVYMSMGVHSVSCCVALRGVAIAVFGPLSRCEIVCATLAKLVRIIRWRRHPAFPTDRRFSPSFCPTRALRSTFFGDRKPRKMHALQLKYTSQLRFSVS